MLKLKDDVNLKENMYVRTKWGIAKYIANHITKTTVYRVVDKKIVYDNIEDWKDCLLDNEITKASHNIIDLIEVGDYVNGYRVDCIENINANNIFILQRIFCEEYEKALYAKSFKPSEIKSIVTKEQFEAMKYEL